MNVVFKQSRGTAAKQCGKRECEDPSQQTQNFARKAAHDADKYRDQRECGDAVVNPGHAARCVERSEEHTSELQSLMRISYAVFCLKKKKKQKQDNKKRN